MLFFNKNNKCGQIRLSLAAAVNSHLGISVDWIQNHVAQCPRCQRRLIGFNRVEIGFNFLKSQPHRLDLLRRANNQAINILKHGLRETPRAKALKQTQPEPKWYQRCARYTHSVGNAAACLAVLLIMRMGIFSSMDKFQTEGQKALKQYYKHQLPEDLSIVDELFET